MRTDLLTPKVLEYVRQRLLGKRPFELSLDKQYSLIDTILMICYGDQSNSYCFDYYQELPTGDIGLEGIISLDSFSLVEYTNSVSDVFELGLEPFNYGLTEEQYFMQSTLIDLGNITYEQLTVILEIREVLKSNIPDWSVSS